MKLSGPFLAIVKLNHHSFNFFLITPPSQMVETRSFSGILEDLVVGGLLVEIPGPAVVPVDYFGTSGYVPPVDSPNCCFSFGEDVFQRYLLFPFPLLFLVVPMTWDPCHSFPFICRFLGFWGVPLKRYNSHFSGLTLASCQLLPKKKPLSPTPQ